MSICYIRSNTRFRDFWEQSCPKDERHAHACRRLAEDADRFSHSPFAIFAQKKEGTFLIGVDLDLYSLPSVPAKYHYVARDGGTTPTRMTIVFTLENGEKIVINRDMLTQIILSILESSWENVDYDCDVVPTFCVDGASEAAAYAMHYFFTLCKRCKYKRVHGDLDALLYAFHLELAAHLRRDKKCFAFHHTLADFDMEKVYKREHLSFCKVDEMQD